MKDKKLKAMKTLSILIAAMGVIHEIATFTPMMAGKFAALSESAFKANTYFSLMCGALLMVCGVVSYMLSDRVGEYDFLRKPFALLQVAMAADGIMAVCFMPHNPFAWAVFALTLLQAPLGLCFNR
ncbi:MAG: hypothetical protein MJZ74_06710 [Muribaculaceae bacterium]|nr:hypothetical protein [Muribaculaceae bacterium]